MILDSIRNWNQSVSKCSQACERGGWGDAGVLVLKQLTSQPSAARGFPLVPDNSACYDLCQRCSSCPFLALLSGVFSFSVPFATFLILRLLCLFFLHLWRFQCVLVAFFSILPFGFIWIINFQRWFCQSPAFGVTAGHPKLPFIKGCWNLNLHR